MFAIGDSVKLVTKWQGRESTTCVGTVEKMTRCYVWFRNNWGNLCKCHSDGRTVGFDSVWNNARIVTVSPECPRPSAGCNPNSLHNAGR